MGSYGFDKPLDIYTYIRSHRNNNYRIRCVNKLKSGDNSMRGGDNFILNSELR